MDSRRFHLAKILMLTCLGIAMLFISGAAGLIFEPHRINIERATSFLVVEGVLLIGGIVILQRMTRPVWKEFLLYWFSSFMGGFILLVVAGSIAGITTWMLPVTPGYPGIQWGLSTMVIGFMLGGLAKLRAQ